MKTPGGAARSRTLVLGFKCGDPADVARLNRHTTLLMQLAACLNDFDCRLSDECLNSARTDRVTTEGPFTDVLLNVPVRGNARVDAVVRMTPVADAEKAVVRVTLDGTVKLRAVGHSQGMRIETDGTTKFTASKLVIFDADGMRTEPATCKADSTLVTRGVASTGPKLFSRFAERIARQRVSESRAEAEAETSAHLAGAIRAGFDQEVATLAESANAAIAAHLAACTEADRVQWKKVRFRTDGESMRVTRHSEAGTALLAAWKPEVGKLHPAIVVRVSRANLDLPRLLAQLAATDFHAAAGEPSPTAPANRMALLKPSLSWQPDALTVSLDFDQPVRVAQEPATTAGQ